MGEVSKAFLNFGIAFLLFGLGYYIPYWSTTWIDLTVAPSYVQFWFQVACWLAFAGFFAKGTIDLFSD